MDVPYSNISSIFSKFENLVDCKEVDVEHFGVSKIIDIKFYSDFWMIHDSRGMIFKFNLEKNILLQEQSGTNSSHGHTESVMSFNTGGMGGLAVSPYSNYCATVGQDGCVRLFDFAEKKELSSREFLGEGSCIEWWAAGSKGRYSRFAAVGYKNGIVRIVEFTKTGIRLVRAWKVHNCAIKTIRFSRCGELLVAASVLGQIFFFKSELEEVDHGAEKIKDLVVTPYCYTELKQKVNTVDWNRNSTHILLSCVSGQVVELKVPKFEDCDFGESYLQENIPQRSYTIKMMMSQKPKKDLHSMAFMMNEEVEEVEVEWDPAPISTAIYLEDEDEQFICSVEGLYAGKLYMCSFSEERPFGSVDCSPDRHNFMRISMDRKYLILGTETGDVFVRPLDFMETFLRIKLHDQDIGSVHGAYFNFEQNCLLTAAEDGTLNVQAVDYSFLERVKNLRIEMKGQKGNEKGMPKNDESGSEDGEEEEEEGEKKDEEEEQKDDEDEDSSDEEEVVDTIVWPEVIIPEGITSSDEVFFEGDAHDQISNLTELNKFKFGDIDDIKNDNIYSIQEEKLMAEEDKRKSQAEVKKQQMRDEIQKLREMFQSLKAKNEGLDDYFQLRFEDLNIDDEYLQIVQERAQDIIDETNKELAYGIAFEESKTKKLKDFYLNELEVDRFSVCGFKKDTTVTSFKVRKPTKYFLARLKEAEEAAQAHIHAEENLGANLEDGHNQETEHDMRLKELMSFKKGLNKSHYLKMKKDVLKKEHQDNSSKEKFTREKMKREKAKRAKLKEEMKDRRPKKENIDDNKDVKDAEKNIGDYKLKCEPDYEIQMNQKMDVFKQRKIIILVEKFIYTVKMDFNKTLQKLRRKKMAIFNKILSTNKRVHEINSELGIEETLFSPTFRESIEFPEKQYEVTEEEVQQKAKEIEQERQRAKKGRFGGMEQEEKTNIEESEVTEQRTIGSKLVAFQELEFKERKGKKTKESKLLDQVKMIRTLRLETEKKNLMLDLENDINTFDQDLEIQLTQKVMLEYEIKIVGMKGITFYEELIIIEAFEQRDNELLERLDEQKQALSELNSKRAELLNANANETDNQKNLLMKLKEAEASYKEKIFPNNTTKQDTVYAIYKLQQKAKEEKEKGEDEGDADGDFDPDYDDEIAQKYDAETRQWAVIAQSDQNAVFIKERYEAERNLQMCQDKLLAMTTQDQKLSEEINIIRDQLRGTRDSIKELQREKMVRVNKLFVSFFLNLSQVKNLSHNKAGLLMLPDNLDSSILFTEDDLSTLNHNKDLLNKQTSEIKSKKEVLKDEEKKLIKINDMLQLAEQEAQAECKENYQLKFGEVISLDILDGLEPTQKLKELRKEFVKEEIESQKQIENAKKAMIATKKHLLELKQENTDIITKITKLGNKQLELNKNLDSTNKNIFKDEKDDKRHDIMRFRRNLKEIIKLLSQQIDGVRNEIGIFKQKGGQLGALIETNRNMEMDD